MATELELKLALTPAALASLRQLPWLAAASRQVLDNTYYDSPDRALRRARIGLRVRVQDGRYIQTLKTSGEAIGGLHCRQEWNQEIPGPELTLSAFPEAARTALAAVPGLDMAALTPVFTTRFERTAYRLPLSGGGEAELALDEGEIQAGERRAPLCELELELLAGEPAALFELAQRCAAEVTLHIANASKAERGYALADAQPVAAPALALSAGMTVAQAVAAWFQFGLRRLDDALLAVGQAPDSEPARNALGEAVEFLRTGVNLFGGPVTRRATLVLREMLQKLAMALDFQSSRTRLRRLLAEAGNRSGRYHDLPGRKTLLALTEAALTAQAEAMASLGERLNDRVFGQEQLRLGAWAFTAGWRGEVSDKHAAQLAQPLPVLVRDRLNKLWREFTAAMGGDRPKRKSDYLDQLPRLQQLYRETGALAPLFEPLRLRAFESSVRALLDGLEELACLDLWRRLGGGLDGENAGLLAGWLSAREEAQLRSLEAIRLTLLKTRTYWCD